jgi:hypothetical protein
MLVRRITNSIRPTVMASLLAKGEAQDAGVPEKGYGETRAVRLGRKTSPRGRVSRRVVGDGTAGRFSVVNRDPWLRTRECGVHARWDGPKNRAPARGQSVRRS